jgi:hypothetical protein
MPQVPKGRLTIDSARPLPSPELTTPRTNAVMEGAAMGDAMQDVGARVTALGVQLLRQEQQRKREILQLETAQRLDQLTDLTLRAPQYTDPTTGQKTGGGVLLQEGKAAYDQSPKYVEEFDLQTGEIAKFAKTEDERLLVGSMIAQRRAQVLNQINVHSSTELRKYEYALMQSNLASTVNRMALTDDPAVRAEGAAEIERILRTHGPRFGIDGDVLTQTIDQFKAKGHDAVVKQLIQDDKYGAAAQYWAKVKDTVQDAEARQAIQERVDKGTTRQKAYAVVDEVMAQLMPNADDLLAPIPTGKIEAAIRERLAKSDPDAYEVAIQEWRSRKGGIEDEKAATLSQVQRPLLTAIMDRKPDRVIRAMPEWNKAPEATQYRLGQMIMERDRADQAERERATDRAYTRTIQDQNLREIREWARLGQLSNPARLKTLTYEQMMEEAITLPVQHGQALQDAWAAANPQNATVAAVVLDEADIKRAFDAAGYGFASQKARSAWNTTELAMYARLEALARQEIDSEQRTKNNGKALPLERKAEILTNILKREVTVVGSWGLTSRVVPAITVKAGDRRYTSVALKDIPEKDLGQAVDWFRKNTDLGRRFIGDDAALVKQYQARFEKAYALRLSGANAEDIYNVLRNFTLPEGR